MGAGAGPPRNRVAHKGLLAWGACLPAPLSSHSEPGPPRQGHRLRPRAWTLALPPPPHRPSQESSVSGPDPGRREGRREEGWAVAGGPGPSPVGTSVGVGAGGGQPRPGPCPESTSPPQAAQPRSHSHLGGLYLFYFPAQPLPGGGLGAGPVLNKQIQMEPGSAAALDLPLSPLPCRRLIARRVGNKGYALPFMCLTCLVLTAVPPVAPRSPFTAGTPAGATLDRQWDRRRSVLSRRRFPCRLGSLVCGAHHTPLTLILQGSASNSTFVWGWAGQTRGQEALRPQTGARSGCPGHSKCSLLQALGEPRGDAQSTLCLCWGGGRAVETGWPCVLPHLDSQCPCGASMVTESGPVPFQSAPAGQGPTRWRPAGGWEQEGGTGCHQVHVGP